MEKQLETYEYLINPQEKRARGITIYQAAKDAGMSTDAYIDKYTLPNGEIAPNAPEDLRDLGSVLTTENLKEYIKNFLSLSVPVGVAVSTKKK